MAKSAKNPLESLDLRGLTDVTPKPKTLKAGAVAETLEITAPVEPDLGPLATLVGTWVGTGFNLIELPNMNQAKPGPPPANKFRVLLNATTETLTFSNIGGDIPNRGNAQEDIVFKGLHYLQQVNDAEKNEGIHLETGLFLNLPSSTDPQAAPNIARLGSIPHGDSLLAQGTFLTADGGPLFNLPPVDPTPFTVDKNGKRVNDTSPEYLALLNNAIPPPGIPKEAIMNPNILLENAIKGQKIIKTVVIFLDANPIDGVSNVSPNPAVGGITNIPFVQVNANASTLTAIFWIETVQNPDGSTFLQLQYTQTVILDFPVFGAPPANQVIPLKWPHISVATLRLQP